ncbi:hypothetical protein EG329_005097 [Mollisiaceae sp. DMI_Dod_QoI]|nr:hypothetical protein EG329_005097 [Helotiales sp. DMI_Dod_QoI]
MAPEHFGHPGYSYQDHPYRDWSDQNGNDIEMQNLMNREVASHGNRVRNSGQQQQGQANGSSLNRQHYPTSGGVPMERGNGSNLSGLAGTSGNTYPESLSSSKRTNVLQSTGHFRQRESQEGQLNNFSRSGHSNVEIEAARTLNTLARPQTTRGFPTLVHEPRPSTRVQIFAQNIIESFDVQAEAYLPPPPDSVEVDNLILEATAQPLPRPEQEFKTNSVLIANDLGFSIQQDRPGLASEYPSSLDVGMSTTGLQQPANPNRWGQAGSSYSGSSGSRLSTTAAPSRSSAVSAENLFARDSVRKLWS